MEQQAEHRWRFFRAGGFDQVRLETAEELLSIGALDQKLWVALACPIKGVEFDAGTLALLDSDADGYVRAPELIAAVQWAGQRLGNAQVLAQQLPGVPLSAIRDDDAIGQRIVQAARELLADLQLDDEMVTVALASAARQQAASRAQAAWQAAGLQASILGEATEAAHAAMLAVQDKVEDWFVRCSLAAFDTRAGEAMNASAESFGLLSQGALKPDAAGIAALPLAQVQAMATLPLDEGLNPAWRDRIVAFASSVVTPLLGAQSELSVPQWQQIKAQWRPYRDWLDSKPDPSAVVQGLLELEKLARFVRDLMTLANNFVAFRDFYARQGSAIFQVGTLYLDGRSCELCVAVNDPAKHAALASLARICLVYLDCVRGPDKMQVAAAFTAGDADQLIVGRNGVFYDRQGRDWNATITKMVQNPISLRQAFWSPYKRLARLISEQAQKLAAGKEKESEAKLGALADQAAKTAATAKAPSPGTPFDVGKFAGIFAAIGLAVGALGTALASVVSGLFTLRWWQIPIALAGLLLVVSGPSMVMAWFKLRSRNLGPILDANGWAVNARARINIPFGTSLTQLAQLPANAERSLTDAYADKKTPWGRYLLLLLVVALALLVLFRRG